MKKQKRPNHVVGRVRKRMRRERHLPPEERTPLSTAEQRAVAAHNKRLAAAARRHVRETRKRHRQRSLQDAQRVLDQNPT